MTRPEPTALARALGRLPSGVYVVTTLHGHLPVGFVGSFVQQVAFEPPTVVLAVGRERDVLPDLRTTGRFALSVLGSGDQALMGPFLKRLAPGATPFDGLVLARTPAGLHVLADALAWLECRVTGEHAAGDHVVFFGAVDSAALLREGDPRVHLRKNGLAY